MRGWRWLAPAVVVLLVVTGWPLVRGVWLSMSTYSLSAPADRRFVGLDNYTEVLSSRSWWLAVATTLVIVVAATAVQLVLGLLFAGSLRSLAARWPVARVVVLVPFALLAVVTAIVWRDAVTTGFVADWFGIDDPGPVGTLAGVMVGETWRGTGIATVILLAGMLSVPASLMASAVADGATAWQRLRRVLLPAMGPAVAVVVAYRALDTFRVLEGPLLVDDPTSSVRTAPALVWTTSLSSFELGLGAATSILLLLVAALLGALVVPLVRVRRVV